MRRTLFQEYNSQKYIFFCKSVFKTDRFTIEIVFNTVTDTQNSGKRLGSMAILVW